MSVTTGDSEKRRLLVFIVAYNAEHTIRDVLDRIPASLADRYHVEILAIDDSSHDATLEQAQAVRRSGRLPFALTVLYNPVNQGYGGNQKLGFHYAVAHRFDVVALLHGDGQYAPEALPDLVAPVAAGEADAVFGSRMLVPGAARRGGMPLYKRVGNRVLTRLQNLVLGSELSEFHSGYRVYAVEALRAIPFRLDSNDFHFDTEIIIQLMRAGRRIVEVPIPTFYGDEICHVNGIPYAWNVVWATLRSRAQDYGVLYDRRFDCLGPGPAARRYRPKLGFASPHLRAVAAVPPGARVLDLGCGAGEVARALREKGCRVTGIDRVRPSVPEALDAFVEFDLDTGPLPVALEKFDVVLLLDVLQHLREPERFVDRLWTAANRNRDLTVLVSVANVGFVVTRLMLALGQFNYGKRGILDLSHTRLYTFSSLRRLFEESGFDVVDTAGVPAPFPFVFGDNALGRAALAANRILIAAWRSMFAYQIYLVARARPSVESLLDDARAHVARRARASAPRETASG